MCASKPKNSTTTRQQRKYVGAWKKKCRGNNFVEVHIREMRRHFCDDSHFRCSFLYSKEVSRFSQWWWCRSHVVASFSSSSLSTVYMMEKSRKKKSRKIVKRYQPCATLFIEKLRVDFYKWLVHCKRSKFSIVVLRLIFAISFVIAWVVDMLNFVAHQLL